MPEEHGALKLKVPTSGDYDPGGGDVPRAFREHADSIAERFTASSGRLLIAQPSDVAKFVAMKGDGTIDAEGNFQLGSKVVGTAELADDSVTAAKIAADQVGSSEIVAGAVGESELADGAASSRKFKPTTGIKTSTALYTPEWKGELSAATIPGTTLEVNPAVASKLIVHTMWSPRFNKVLATLQPFVHWTKGASEAAFAVAEMPSHSAELDVTMPYSWTVEVPLTAGSNNAVDLRSYASVGSAGKLTLPVGAAAYSYMVVAT